MIEINVSQNQEPIESENTAMSLPGEPMPEQEPMEPIATSAFPEGKSAQVPTLASEPVEVVPERVDPEALLEEMFPRASRVAWQMGGADPDAAYSNWQLSKESGLAQEVVGTDPKSARANHQITGTMEALQNYPHVSRWAVQNPEGAKVAQANWSDFTAIEANARAWGSLRGSVAEFSENIQAGWQLGREVALAGQAYYDDPNSERAKALGQRVRELNAGVMPETAETAGYTLGQILGTLAYSGQAFARGAAPVVIAGVPLMAATGPAGVSATGVASFVAGTAAMMGAYNATKEIEAGMFIHDAVERGITPEQARDAAELAGAINGTLEVASDALGVRLMKPLFGPILRRAINGSLIERLLQGTTPGLRRPSALRATGSAVAATTFGAAGEATTEVFQDFVNSYVAESLDLALGLKAQNKLHTEEGLQELAQTAQKTWWQVFKASLLLYGSGASVGLYGNLRAAEESAQAQRDFVAALNDAVTQSESGKRYPDVVKDYAANELQSNGVEQVYIDNASFAQAMVDTGVTIDDLGRANPDIASEVRRATSEGGDVVLSVNDFVNTVVGTDLGNRLTDEVRLSEDSLSLRELSTRRQEADAMFAQSMQALENEDAAMTQVRQYQAELEEIEKRLYTQIRLASKGNDRVTTKAAHDGAMLVRQFFAAQSLRMGVTPKALYEQLPITVTSDGAIEFGGAPGGTFQPTFGFAPIAQMPDSVVTLEVEGVKALPVRKPEAAMTEDLRNAGFTSMDQAVYDATQNYSQVNTTDGKVTFTRPVAVRDGDKVRRGSLAVELQEDGDAYRVNSVTVSRTDEVIGEVKEGQFAQRLSTALPSKAAVKSGAQQDPRFVRQWANYEAAKRNPEFYAKVLQALKAIPGMKAITHRMRNPDRISEAVINRMADNLVWLYNKMPEEARNRARLWYDGGRKTAVEWAKRYGLRERQTAAIIAIFSPQNGWFNNMTNAERTLDIYFGARHEVPDEAVNAELKRLCKKEKKFTFDDIKGQTLDQLIQSGNMRAAALWVRAYDKVKNPPAYNVITPEGGEGGRVKTSKGNDAAAFYMGTATIARALSVIVDGSAANISQQIGKQFKVRNFYNNIYDPANPDAATIDTHAVGADTLTVVSSTSDSVADNFGSIKNAVSGQNGTYPWHFEAYRRAAERVGVLPREMQSITWEAIRVLFPQSKKKRLQAKVDAIWQEHDAGLITIDEAREKIFEATGGFDRLAWEDTPFNDQITETYDRSGVTLYDITPPTREHRISVEAAPNPNDAQAVARWNELTNDEKFEVTQEVVEFALEQTAAATGTWVSEGRMQLGGYLGDTNFSVYADLAETSDPVHFAAVLAKVLRQDSVMVLCDNEYAGTSKEKLIRLRLPDGFTPEQIDDLYRNHLDTLTDGNGERLITGMSVVEGVFTSTVDAERADFIQKRVQAALESIGIDSDIWVDDAYCAFVKPVGEQSNADNHQGRGRKKVRQDAQSYDDLQASVDQAFNSAVERVRARRSDGTGRTSDGRVSAGDVEGVGQEGRRYGRPQEGSISLKAIHYSRQSRPVLDTHHYGTGMRGAEARRIAGTDLTQRLYFYVDEGQGIRPESAVGNYRHSITLDNIYDLRTDPLGIAKAAKDKDKEEGLPYEEQFNAMERAIRDAGFDGYYQRAAQGSQGVVCLLGDHTIEVDELGAEARTQSTPAIAYKPTQRRILYLNAQERQLEPQIRALAEQFIAKYDEYAIRLTDGQLTYADIPEIVDAVNALLPRAATKAMLYQREDSGIRGAYIPAMRRIKLTKNADASTFFHEAGHFFLDATMQLAGTEQATEQTRQDAQTLLDWFGVESLDAWHNLSTEEQAKYHEQFAYNYERYLFEGVAPEGRIRQLFLRFTEFLKGVYRDIMGQTNTLYRQQFGVDLPELSDDVRRVMDRLIASDTAVERAVQVRALSPLVAMRARGGLTDEEWAEYVNQNEEAVEAAKVTMRVRQLRSAKRLLSRVDEERRAARATARNKRAELRKKFTEEVRLNPIYRARHFLRTGEVLDEEGGLVGKEANHKLAKPGDKRQDVVPARWVMDLFGIDMSEEEFATTIKTLPSVQAEVTRRVDAAMQEEFSMLEDPDTVDQQVAEALANDGFAYAIAAEFKALREATQPVRLIVSYAKTAAENIMSRTPIANISASRYSRAETRARAQSQRALARGDLNTAVEMKRQEMLNHELTRLARQAEVVKDRLGKIRRNAFKPNKQLAKARNMDFVTLVRALFAEFGLATDAQGVTVQKALEAIRINDPDLAESINSMVEATRDALGSRRGGELTYKDLLTLNETIKAQWELSRSSKTSMIEGQQLEQDELMKELIKVFSDHVRQGRQLKAEPVMSGSAGFNHRLTERLLGANAALRRMESWCRAMDGNTRGPFTRYLYEPVADAARDFRTRKGEVLEKLKAILQNLELTDDLYRAAELDNEFWTEKSMTKAQILHALLHTGNASNKKKLLLGYGWGKLTVDPVTGEERIDDSAWQAFINRLCKEKVLTKADFDAVQAIWDLFDEIKLEAQRANKEIYGYYFDEIAADPVSTPFGVYRGGYAPAIVDPGRVDLAERQNMAESLGMTGDSFMMPQAPNGFTKQRVENYSKPLLLDLGLIGAHVDKVLRFAYIAPRVREVYRLVGSAHSPLVKLIGGYDPRIVREMVIPWLARSQGQYVSKPSDVTKSARDLDNFWRMLRTNSSMAAMAGNILNTLQQYTGISVAASRVPAKFLRRALRENAVSPQESRRFVVSRSEWMRQRLEANLFELSGEIESLILPQSKIKEARVWIQQHGYFMQQFAQNCIDVPIWNAAFVDAKARGLSDIAAIRHADEVIRSTQGSFAPEDMSRIEAGTPASRLFTMFYSYFNMQYNLLATELGAAWIKKDYLHAAYTYFTVLVVPTLLSRLLMDAAGGFDTGDDDDLDGLDLLRVSASEVAAANFALIPVLGNTVNYLFGLGRSDRYIPSPVVSSVETFGRLTTQIGNALDPSEEASLRRAVRDSLNAFSYATGIPLGQLGKPLGYTAGVIEGEFTPEDASDVIRGLISGRDVSE